MKQKVNIRLNSKKADNSSYEKQIFDLKQLLGISKSLSSILDYSTLIESILYTCIGQMRVLGVGVFTKKSFDSPWFNLNRNYSGFELNRSYEYVVHEDHPFVQLLCETNTCYTINEINQKLVSFDGLEAITSLHPSLIIPLKVKSHINGILILGERIDTGDDAEFSDYEREMILNIASLAAIAVNNSAMLEMTTTDMMTHLKLKHYFYSVLIDKLELCEKELIHLSVLMLDIDFFKKFNDTYGHSCGDVVLQKVARIIEEGIRNQDLAARYGGEEFVIMLYDADAQIAMSIAERIRKNIEEMDIIYEDQHLNVTISIGVTEFYPNEKNTAKTLVDQADQALYASKRNGRNKVTLATA